MQLNDLDGYSLLMVLDQLSLADLFKLRRVNNRVKEVAETKMRVKIQVISLCEITEPRSAYRVHRFSSECTHLDADIDQELNLESFFKKHLKKRFDNDLREPSRQAYFFSWLAIFSDIKSIDFGNCKLPGHVLLEAVKRCPELQCLKLSHSLVKEEDWHRVLDLVGTQIIHFTNHTVSKPSKMFTKKTKLPIINFPSDPTELSLLSLLAAKCGNIQQVDWLIEGGPTNDLLAAFKTLPKSFRVALRCDYLRHFEFKDVFKFEDVVDELRVERLKWSHLKDRYDRLSSFKLLRFSVGGPVHGIDFAGLKKLDLSEWWQRENQTVNCLVASHFPRLEEFCFNPQVGLIEDDYEALFRKMKTVKKLTIVLLSRSNFFLLPGSAILHLKNLDTIDFDIVGVSDNFQYIDFLRIIEQYLKEIKSLKKLVVDLRHFEGHYLWEWLVVKKVRQMKSKQSRVQVDSFAKP